MSRSSSTLRPEAVGGAPNPGDGTRSVAETVAWARRALIACGMSEEDAGLGASRLVRADMRNVRTHGIALLPAYAESIRQGHMNATPRLTIEDHGDHLLADADNGLGQVAMAKVLDAAVAACAERAIVAVSVRRVGHLGALGSQIVVAAEAGLVGLLVQNTQPLVGLQGSTRPAIGNDPFAFAIPRAGDAPLVFDAAVSAVSLVRIRSAAAAGLPIPADWALDETGAPTTDPSRANVLLPFGGYKGIALAMLFETLAGSLSGMRPEAIGGIPVDNGAFAMLLNPQRFLPRRSFDAHVADWISTYLAADPEARIPGAQAAKSEADCAAAGIAMPASLMSRLDRLAGELGIAPL